MAIDWEDGQAPALSEANLEQWGSELVAAAGSGIELGYAQITSTASTTNSSFEDVSGLSVTVTVGTRPVVVKFGCGGVESTNDPGLGAIRLVEDSTAIAVANWYLDVSAANITSSSVHREARRNPSAGSHTYKVQFTRTAFGAGTFKIDADSGTSFGPAFIQVIEV